MRPLTDLLEVIEKLDELVRVEHAAILPGLGGPADQLGQQISVNRDACRKQSGDHEQKGHSIHKEVNLLSVV